MPPSKTFALKTAAAASLLALTGVWAPAAFAQTQQEAVTPEADEAATDSAAKSDTATLDAVVITAAGFEQDIKEAPASISVVTREELSQGSYSNLHDALRDIPGINFQPSDNNSRDISLRGMGAEYTLILIDGKRMSTRETQTNGSTGTDESWTPPLEAIERIEVVRGPMSSLYGSDAMGGVVNIITRKVAKQWMGTVRTEATLQERSESGNAYGGNFYLSGPLVQDRLGLSLTGNYRKREEDKILSGYNDHSSRSLNAKLALTPNAQHDILFEVGKSRQKFVSTPGYTQEEDGTLSERDFDRNSVSLQHKGRWGWATSDTFVQQERVKNVGRGMTLKNTQLTSSWIAPLGQRHILSAGLSYDKADLLDTTTNRLPNATRTTADRSQWALYAENEWRVTDTLALTGGLRYDHDSQAGGNFSPRIYAVWQATPNWTVKGGISTGFKAPKMRQTLVDWGAVSRGGTMYGNPDLKPEKLLSKEVGVIYDTNQGFMASATVFHNDFKDRITMIPCPQCGPNNQWGRPPRTYINVDEAVTQGLEASLAAQLGTAWRLKANYTYTDSEQKTGAGAGQPLSQLPKHLFSTTANWQVNPQASAWARLNYRGQESDGASATSFKQRSYAFFDIGGAYHFNKNVALRVGIYNLFDKEVLADGVNYDTVEDGRRYWLGLSVGF